MIPSKDIESVRDWAFFKMEKVVTDMVRLTPPVPRASLATMAELDRHLVAETLVGRKLVCMELSKQPSATPRIETEMEPVPAEFVWEEEDGAGTWWEMAEVRLTTNVRPKIEEMTEERRDVPPADRSVTVLSEVHVEAMDKVLPRKVLWVR